MQSVKKRRRWLIVAFVLVLASLGTWWQWPRGDARFVGKWASYIEGSDAAQAYLTLRSDGSGRTVQASGRNPVVYEWTVSNNEFVIGTRSPSKSKILELIRPLFRRQGSDVYIWSDVMQILEASPNEIRLGRAGTDMRMILRRVAE